MMVLLRGRKRNIDTNTRRLDRWRFDEGGRLIIEVTILILEGVVYRWVGCGYVDFLTDYRIQQQGSVE